MIVHPWARMQQKPRLVNNSQTAVFWTDYLPGFRAVHFACGITLNSLMPAHAARLVHFLDNRRQRFDLRVNEYTA